YRVQFYSCSMQRTAGLCATPSFPTRRSSDLRGELPHLLLNGGMVGVNVGTLRPELRQARLNGLVLFLQGCQSPFRRAWRNSGLRSEEHTSELQSRGHLVCRLLLEKKNQNTSD